MRVMRTCPTHLHMPSAAGEAFLAVSGVNDSLLMYFARSSAMMRGWMLSLSYVLRRFRKSCATIQALHTCVCARVSLAMREVCNDEQDVSVGSRYNVLLMLSVVGLLARSLA
jgi:hypothetical protein